MTNVSAPPTDYSPRIHDLPQSERPRERLIRYGASSMSSAELIAILLRTGVLGQSALAIAQRLLAKFSGLRGLATASYGELTQIKGLSGAKYCQVMAAIELGRRSATLGAEERRIVRTADDVADLLLGEMGLLSQEHLRVVLLTTKNHIAGVHNVYVGTVNTSQVRASEVLRPAVRENAPSVIVVHNHPSGDPTPSASDIDLTRQLIQAARLLNIEVLDHVVLGHDTFVSMKERNLGFDTALTTR